MFYDENPSQLGRFEFGIIKRKVLQLIGRAGFTEADQDDLRQQLITRLLQGLESFDPQLGPRQPFVTAIVERAVATLLRDAQAQKRDPRRVSSLNVRVQWTHDDSAELAASISNHQHDARTCSHTRSDEEQAQLASDVAAVIDSLPKTLQELAEALKGQNISETARDLGVPRTTLNSRIRELRQRFEKAALRDYL